MMIETVTSFFRRRCSERTLEKIRRWAPVSLYGWVFLVVAAPIVLFRRLGIIPLGHRGFVGTPLVRYYWHRFLSRHTADFRGDAAEIDSTVTIRRWGEHNREQGGEGLRSARAIDVAGSGEEDYVADLADCWNMGDCLFDLLLVQFTYHMIRRDTRALLHSIRLLKPGGVVICNFPALTGNSPKGWQHKGQAFYIYRSYTPRLVEMLAEAGLAPADYEMAVNGNWLARILYTGFYLPKEIVPGLLLADDPAYPLLISVRIKRPAGWVMPRERPGQARCPAGSYPSPKPPFYEDR